MDVSRLPSYPRFHYPAIGSGVVVLHRYRLVRHEQLNALLKLTVSLGLKMGSAIVQQVRPVALTHAEQVGIDLCEPVIELSPPLANQWDRPTRPSATHDGLHNPPRAEWPNHR